MNNPCCLGGIRHYEVKQYGVFQYRVVTSSLEMTERGLTLAFDCEMVTTLINGYILSFQYMALTNTDED